jgi:hypothetical protein
VSDADLPPLTTGPDGPDGPLDHEARRWRTLRRFLLGGLAIAFAGAVVVGVLGASGRSGLAAFFVGAALVTGLGAVLTFVAAGRDELRDRPVRPRRVAVGVALLLTAPVCLVLAAGAAGAA